MARSLSRARGFRVDDTSPLLLGLVNGSEPLSVLPPYRA